ncbi:inner centromere protein Mis6 [Schizosaccharomyces cryophilus OY26]|uniref:Inner centromere protein Mis6 n=1 Tax=Schizosaccharomyces cryophilus (strain OY26 / ATCC MYA-4695 / CBS 11777 / NBRC 106824 / NRRL Y48691) TaxID=653667 RepID=S9X117_SCHCR|nr:inner centromere protein Mis6 [Schizosaccharomyces cryophilus OY26]EPY50747.1 inner centromere protein Mis6 [Schizosaccharomyces cryophilus OY26]
MTENQSHGFYDLQDGIEWINRASEAPVGSKKVVSSRLRQFQGLASQEGLTNEAIESLLNVALSFHTKFDKSQLTIIIKSLYPKQLISHSIAVKILGCLDPYGVRYAYAYQEKLLNWLAHVYEFLEDKDRFAKFYGVLFHFLDYVTLRPSLVRLLILTTKHSYIKRFRIYQLLSLYQKPGNANDPYILELLYTYKQHYPDVIIGSFQQRRAMSWKMDVFWVARVSDLIHSSTVSSQSMLRLSEKRKRVPSLIPELLTMENKIENVSLNEVFTISQLSSTFEKVKQPNQVAAVLHSYVFFLYYRLLNENSLISRLTEWLYASLYHGLLFNYATLEQRLEFFHFFYRHLLYSNNTFPFLYDFIRKYLMKPSLPFKEYEAICHLMTCLDVARDEQECAEFFKQLNLYTKKLSLRECEIHLSYIFIWTLRLVNKTNSRQRLGLAGVLLNYIFAHLFHLLETFFWNDKLFPPLALIMTTIFNSMSDTKLRVWSDIVPIQKFIQFLFMKSFPYAIETSFRLIQSAEQNLRNQGPRDLQEHMKLIHQQMIQCLLNNSKKSEFIHAIFSDLNLQSMDYFESVSDTIWSLTSGAQFSYYTSQYLQKKQEEDPTFIQIPSMGLTEPMYLELQRKLHLAQSWSSFQNGLFSYLKTKHYKAIHQSLLSLSGR